MNNNVILKLINTLKINCKMDIHPPSTADYIDKMKRKIPMMPASILELYLITDGVEINVPGTVIYDAETIINKYDLMEDKQWCVLGNTNFGDELFFNAKGEIIQVDHENGEEFLRWESLECFLLDEIDALS